LATGDVVVCAAVVARFYNEPLRWGLAMPLPELIGWHEMIPQVREHDPLASAVWLMRKPPGEE
jgi:hypothetical protein